MRWESSFNFGYVHQQLKKKMKKKANVNVAKELVNNKAGYTVSLFFASNSTWQTQLDKLYSDIVAKNIL